MISKRFLREPLLHFLVAGGVLFGIFSWTHRGATNRSPDKTIVVDKEALLNYLQYRNKAFQPEYFTAQLDGMSDSERQELVTQYVEEETLYREAKALGLEQGDYVIRQRLLQKMRFLMDDLADTGGSANDAALEEYLGKNKDQYVIDASVTFTHVFVDSSVHGDKAAKNMAEQLRARLVSGHVAFNDAPQFGDRFPFLQNYVERTFDYVASHFGNEFIEALKKIAPSDTQWSGPIRSTNGYHLVLITSRTEARVPTLQEIHAQVEEDWLRDRTEKVRGQSLKELAAQYVIERKDISGKNSH